MVSEATAGVSMEYLRDKLKDRLLASLDEVYINGTMEHRLPNNLNISFAYVEGESLLMGINDVAVSSGSAGIRSESSGTSRGRSQACSTSIRP